MKQITLMDEHTHRVGQDEPIYYHVRSAHDPDVVWCCDSRDLGQLSGSIEIFDRPDQATEYGYVRAVQHLGKVLSI